MAWISPKGPQRQMPQPWSAGAAAGSGPAALGAVRERGAGRRRKTSLRSHLWEAWGREVGEFRFMAVLSCPPPSLFKFCGKEKGQWV